MARDPVLWLSASLRILIKRVEELEKKLAKQCVPERTELLLDVLIPAAVAAESYSLIDSELSKPQVDAQVESNDGDLSGPHLHHDLEHSPSVSRSCLGNGISGVRAPATPSGISLTSPASSGPLSSRTDVFDDFCNMVAISFCLSAPSCTAHDFCYPWNVAAASFEPGAALQVDLAHCRPLQLARDLAEVLSCDRTIDALSDHFMKAGLITYRTIDNLGTGVAGDAIQAAIVDVFMSEHCFIERGDVFEMVQDTECVNEKYLLFLIGEVKARLDRLDPD
jgi:hypothetical protein